MLICNDKNNLLVNVDNVKCVSVLKGKHYYDENAVQKNYYYVCADGIKLIKFPNQSEAVQEFQNVKGSLLNGDSVYNANGLEMTEDELGNCMD